MKKLLLTLMLLMLAVPVAANQICPGTCPGPTAQATPCDSCVKPVDISGSFFTSTERTINNCGMVCPGQGIGQYDWDGDEVVTLDLTTGQGFCKPPTPCLYWLLCECDAADEIEVNGKYGITVEILTPGVEFESVASVDPPTVTMSEFEDKKAMCGGDNPVTQELLYHFTDGTHSVLVTNSYRGLFRRNSLYIAICNLPRLIVDNRIVPYGTLIKVRLGLFDGNIVCQPDCSRLCECTQAVALAACQDECCAILSYLPCGLNWWAGIAITNLDPDHAGSCSVAFVTSEGTKIKTYRLEAHSIQTILVNDEVEGDSPNAFAVIKSSFPMRAVAFGGDSNSAFALPATSCHPCGE